MGEKRKKSWREIDRMKDRSSHRSSSQPDALEKALQDSRLKKMYLEEAEKLFKGPKGRPEHAKDLQKIHNNYGKAGFGKAVKHYINTYGMPDDWGTLMLLLDYDDSEIVVKAIEILADIAGEKGPVERRGLKSKLNTMKLLCEDYEIIEAAEEALNNF